MSPPDVVDLLQRAIRNACVNEGTVTSGGETRNADLIQSELGSSGFDVERFEPVPGRANVIARIEGSDSSAPSLALMGHTDVVPANPSRWRRDPFGGELIDGEVWGRGAVDMLNLTTSMAVAFARLAARGFRPRGTLLYMAVADEETGGDAGARWLVEHEPDSVRADWMVTEFGGMRVPTAPPDEPALPVAVAEKGANWVKVRFHGTPGHASMPFGSDNALLKAAEAVRRIAAHRPEARVVETWRRFVEGLRLPDDVTGMLVDPSRVEAAIAMLPDPALARLLDACTHTTIAPTVMHAGVKTNVIPDTAEFEVDVRSLEEGPDEIKELIAGALGDLAAEAEIEVAIAGRPTQSAVDTPLWDALSRNAAKLVPGARIFPMLLAGATDSRFFRRLDTVCYGFGMYSDRISFAEFGSMFHGDDERIDVDSLRMSADFWEALAIDLLG